MDYAEIYAVDFDGTLNMADTYPELGEPNMELIEFFFQFTTSHGGRHRDDK